MEALTAWAIPTWLTGIKVGKIAPEKRPAILAFKREAADVLYRHFAQRSPALSAPATLVPSEPITKPAAPGADATPEDWLTYHQQMVTWLEWQRDIEQWRARVESRLDSHEEVLRLVPEILERLGPQTLSPEHQRTVQAGVNRLHDLTNRSYGAIYDELRQAFHVGAYKDIPEVRWLDVVAWFQARIGRAGGGKTPQQGSLF